MGENKKLDLDTVRRKLSEAKGKQYWRSLEEIAESEEFTGLLQQEFPRYAPFWENAIDRRSFLKVMAGSLALAGLSACTKQPDEKIVPYVNAPEQIVPGKPLFFATAFPFCGYAQGVLVRSDMGRPTKIEGNPQHPASLGASDIFTQASLLSLYDPDRSQVILHRGEIGTWDDFTRELGNELRAQDVVGGAGLRILTGAVTSPTLLAQFQSVLARYPRAKWYQYEAVGTDNAADGARSAFGTALNTLYHFDRAEVVLSFESDFLCWGPTGTRYEREFADRRRVIDGKKTMNRLYVLESTPTVTGSAADHRFPMHPAAIEMFAFAIAERLGISIGKGNISLLPEEQHRLDVIVADLQQHHGASIVIPGEYQSAPVHTLCHLINERLGNSGTTLEYIEPVAPMAGDNQVTGLRELVSDMEARKVDLLLILGVNPVYTAPFDISFARAMNNVSLRVNMGLYDSETAALSHWHIPESHYLESWSDARAFDGTVSLLQPLIAPLYDTRSVHDIVQLITGDPLVSGYDIVKNHWRAQYQGADFESLWTKSLNDGIMGGTAFSPRQVVPKSTPDLRPSSSAQSGLTVLIRPDPSIWDGSFVNNAWLQELPKPLTKLTWDNAAMISPAMAVREGLANEDVIELKHGNTIVHAPVWVLPGQADNCITLHLGYGRTRVGRVGKDTGFNTYPLRTSDNLWFQNGVEIRKTGDRYPLSVTQRHHSMETREPVRSGTLAEYIATPTFPMEVIPPPPKEKSLYPPFPYEDYAWGMSIDLNACTGCNACVIACQSENNIPIVGKEQVAREREMHWIRVDAYFRGELDNPAVEFQPLACVHCENAPCEEVCPVAATVHDHEGLNVMVYNRCVGTRYCSNNCPYKVRRFNFLEYNGNLTDTQKMQENPNVTVRSRGIMEKCSYCIQRISAARIEAKKDDRHIKDGEIVPACQQACPAQAIVFGNINDHGSQVYKRKQEPRDYALLAELNTHPRTSYLARLRNPNPALGGKVQDNDASAAR